jgi:hypothetical protein
MTASRGAGDPESAGPERLAASVALGYTGAGRFIIKQRGQAAAVVMGYDDYRALANLLTDLEDVRDVIETEDEPARPLSEYLAEPTG